MQYLQSSSLPNPSFRRTSPRQPRMIRRLPPQRELQEPPLRTKPAPRTICARASLARAYPFRTGVRATARTPQARGLVRRIRTGRESGPLCTPPPRELQTARMRAKVCRPAKFPPRPPLSPAKMRRFLRLLLPPIFPRLRSFFHFSGYSRIYRRERNVGQQVE